MYFFGSNICGTMAVSDMRLTLDRFFYHDSTSTLIKNCMLKQKCPCNEGRLHWLSETTGVVFDYVLSERGKLQFLPGLLYLFHIHVCESFHCRKICFFKKILNSQNSFKI